MKRLSIVLALLMPLLLPAQKDNKEIPRENKEWKEGNLSVTKHQVTTTNGALNYTATTGYMEMKDEKDTLKANLFFIAYTKDGETDPSKRPILFSFNGGPGSSSVWLHMGVLGPKIVLMTEEGNTLPPPYKYVDNPNTWLDKADIVFIDPMMTGFTRPAGKNLHNLNLPAMKMIFVLLEILFVLYLSKYGRWSSPKFIAGESYGTTRAAGLSGYLQERYNLNVNGIILISAILDFGTVRTDRGNDVPFPLGLAHFCGHFLVS